MIKSFLNYFTKQPEKNVIEHVGHIPDREIVNEIIKNTDFPKGTLHQIIHFNGKYYKRGIAIIGSFEYPVEDFVTKVVEQLSIDEINMVLRESTRTFEFKGETISRFTDESYSSTMKNFDVRELRYIFMRLENHYSVMLRSTDHERIIKKFNL